MWKLIAMDFNMLCLFATASAKAHTEGLHYA